MLYERKISQEQVAWFSVLCMYYENRYFFALTDTWFSQHDIVIGSRFTPLVLNDGQFSRGPHCWWNSTINQLLSPCRTVDAGEKVSLNIRNLESWLFIGCRLWMIMILNHSSSGLNPNPLLLLQLLILMNTFFTPWTPAELLELPF